jgi:glycosyltransferase involved in cell wall biosynthesis
MQVAYLINQYPKISHTFIRREILALEQLGITVKRYSIRQAEEKWIDINDLIEFERTQVILSAGLLNLGFNTVNWILRRPLRFWQTLRLTVGIGWHSERGLWRHLIYLIEACQLLRWLIESKCQHLHAHFGTNSATVAMLCRSLGGCPYSFTVHGPEEFDKAILISLKEKIQRAAFVVAISSFGRSQLMRICPFTEWAKIKVVHCGVDDVFLSKSHVPIPNDREIVCIGRLCEQKGQLLLIEATAKLVSQGIDVHLTFVGDGEMRPQMEELIRINSLETNIVITGWASSEVVQKFILAARALVLPSFAEGLPVVLMESLALGRPVISTYIAGIPELVVPGENGWLIPAGSVTDLVEAIKSTLLAPVQQLEIMGEAGRKRVAEHYNSKIYAKQLSLYFKYQK